MTSRRTLLRTMVLATGAIATSSIIPPDSVAATSIAQHPRVVLPNDDASTAAWACWIGHSTVLLRIGGMWILTDPVLFGSYGVSILGVTLGPMRITEPALTLDEVPRPDLILLSHAHMDHMDRTTLRRISQRWPAQIDVITATNTRDIIEDFPWKSLNELDWCESTQIGTIVLTALQVRHNGWRLPGEPCRAEGFRKIGRSYNGYLIEYNGICIVFGGDTAYTTLFKSIVQKPDLAIMPIGAYDPFPEAHCTPEESLAMVEMMGARSIMPIHHSTFRQSQEPVADPLRRLRHALRRSSTQLSVHGIGDSCEFSKRST